MTHSEVKTRGLYWLLQILVIQDILSSHEWASFLTGFEYTGTQIETCLEIEMENLVTSQVKPTEKFNFNLSV